MNWKPEIPYNNLPSLPPQIDVESKKVLKAALLAGRALAELKGLGDILPNQSILINSLVLQEAKASSEIENIITTHDALFRAFSSQLKKIDPATKEVLRYREALWKGYKSLGEKPLLNTNLFIKIVQTIKKNTAGIRATPGTTLTNESTGEIIYTPPSDKSIIKDKLKNLEDFIHIENNIDPLIKLAIIHYQFESIHPFPDGNGRAGRIINILFLIQQGLLDSPILYLSKYITDNKNDYYRFLRRVTSHNDWESWILFILDGVRNTANYTVNRITEIRNLIEETNAIAKSKLPSFMYSKELIELLFKQPYVKGQFIVNAKIAKRQTAAEYLKELEKIGILSIHKLGKENLYLNDKLFNILSK